MSLLVPGKTADASLSVRIHPSVLLVVTDALSRWQHRRATDPASESTPIAGALLGRQDGRHIILEVAFDAKIVMNNATAHFDQGWFTDRLQQYKDVNKAPAVELVGWWSTCPVSGPEAVHVPIHSHVVAAYNPAAIFLALHPSQMSALQQSDAALPISVYESVDEANAKSRVDPQNEDVRMGEGSDSRTGLGSAVRFRQLPYTIETDQVEMIVLDSLAREAAVATPLRGPWSLQETKDRPGGKTSAKKNRQEPDQLSPADEQLIRTIQARSSAIQMLSARITKIQSYLEDQPESYLRDDKLEPKADEKLEHTHLRSIQALLTRLPLLLPPTKVADFRRAFEQESAQVAQFQLLGALGTSVVQTADLGRKYAAVDLVRASSRRTVPDMVRPPDDGGTKAA